jgi:hypothetical protein
MKLPCLTRRAFCGFVATGTVLTLLSGCGGPYTGTVSGKVLYNGTPLPGGQVTFLHPDGRSGQAQIQEDGSYTVPVAPGGEVKCTVETLKPIPGLPARTAAKIGAKPSEPVFPAGKYVPIPKKYARPETTDLGYTIHRGSQEINIELKD